MTEEGFADHIAACFVLLHHLPQRFTVVDLARRVARQPRELEHSLVSFTEWAVEGGIDHDTRRQQKKPEAV